VDDLGPLLEEVVQHTDGQAQGQQQRGRLVEGKLEAQHVHDLGAGGKGAGVCVWRD
jgi:hypothetical protein